MEQLLFAKEVTAKSSTRSDTEDSWFSIGSRIVSILSPSVHQSFSSFKMILALSFRRRLSKQKMPIVVWVSSMAILFKDLSCFLKVQGCEV